MKRTLLIIGLNLLGLALLAIPPLPPQPITLGWDGDTTNTDIFELRGSNDISQSWSNWPVIARIPGNQTNITLTTIPGQMFYVVIASNFWGYALPSNITNTPSVLIATNHLNIHH